MAMALGSVEERDLSMACAICTLQKCNPSSYEWIRAQLSHFDATESFQASVTDLVFYEEESIARSAGHLLPHASHTFESRSRDVASRVPVS